MSTYNDLPATQMVQKGIPRWIEAPVALIALIALAPVMAVLALAIAVTSGMPVLFHQKRVGRGGKLFTLVKFRTMTDDRSTLQVTASDDLRVTPVGKILRRTKLDELPEFWNVLKGEMSLVGPRPEVPLYVDLHDKRWQEILAARPGLTDAVTLSLCDEESLMATVKEGRERFYLTNLQGYKLEGYIQYLRSRTWWTDTKILALTARVLVQRRSAPPMIDEIIRASSGRKALAGK